MFQDDKELIYSAEPTVARTLDVLRALGVDRPRLTLLWARGRQRATRGRGNRRPGTRR